MNPCRKTVFRLEEISRSLNETKIDSQDSHANDIVGLFTNAQIAIERLILLYKAKAFDEVVVVKEKEQV